MALEEQDRIHTDTGVVVRMFLPKTIVPAGIKKLKYSSVYSFNETPVCIEEKWYTNLPWYYDYFKSCLKLKEIF